MESSKMPESKKHARAGDALVEQRIEMVVDMMIQGHSESRIQRSLAKTEQISEKQAKRYINKAKECLTLFGSQPALFEKGILEKRLNYLFTQASQQKDISRLIEILRCQTHFYQINLKYAQHRGPNDAGTSPAKDRTQPGLEALLRFFEGNQSTD